MSVGIQAGWIGFHWTDSHRGNSGNAFNSLRSGERLRTFNIHAYFCPRIMKHLLKSHLGRLRVIAWLEGWSLLLLLFIAMPVKYLLDVPEATQAIGLIHGVLFVLFISSTVVISIVQRWHLGRIFVVMASSFLPFGTFYVDRTILSKLS